MRVALLLSLCCSAALCRLPAQVFVVNDDGAWNWLQDKRAVMAGDCVIAASVASGRRDPARVGDVEVASRDLITGASRRFTLHRAGSAADRHYWMDDHNCPALWVRPDGRLLAVYSLHGRDEKFYSRVSTLPGDAGAWQEERVFSAGAGARVALPNLVFLPDNPAANGKLWLFFRGLGAPLAQSWASSDDAGETWNPGGPLLQFPASNVPYVKYVGDGHGAVHLAFTDGHRVSFHNGVYHAVYRAGRLWQSDGRPLADLNLPVKSARSATEIFRANPQSVVMISDLALDPQGRPRVVYSVELNTGASRPRPIGADHRYRYAWWTGTAWHDVEAAHAGTEVHAVPDDDCTGLAALDPGDPRRFYISTNADPVTGAPLISRADGMRHWEIFSGVTGDGGETWSWSALTHDSSADNIRPVVPVRIDRPAPLLWLRGKMRMPEDYTLEVVGLARE